jgi:hypothetical protein
LSSALAGIDVVVSVLGYSGIEISQLNLAEASKVTKVNLFIASEFAGVPPGDEIAKRLGPVPATRTAFYTGTFLDILFKLADRSFRDGL